MKNVFQRKAQQISSWLWRGWGSVTMAYWTTLQEIHWIYFLPSSLVVFSLFSYLHFFKFHSRHWNQHSWLILWPILRSSKQFLFTFFCVTLIVDFSRKYHNVTRKGRFVFYLLPNFDCLLTFLGNFPQIVFASFHLQILLKGIWISFCPVKSFLFTAPAWCYCLTEELHFFPVLCCALTLFVSE